MRPEAAAGEEHGRPMRARTLIESFRFAFAGVAYAFRTQRNVRVHVLAAAAVTLLAWAVGLKGVELAVLVLAIGAVLAAELLNTAVETVVDLVTPAYHPLAAVAKNVAAGGVLVVACAAAVIGYIVFVPYLPPLLAALSSGGLAAALALAQAAPRKVMAVDMASEGPFGLSEAEVDKLVAAAREARERAYAPYSGFLVGAALMGESGEIFTGCNMENASYGATICAERVALGSAVAHGQRAFRALAVVTDVDDPAPPCGICRQTLSEFAPDMPVILANLKGKRRVVALAELIPGVFHLPSREG